jgi:hypothetical protein
MHLVQILLPVRGRNGAVRDDAFARTRFIQDEIHIRALPVETP